ncbi:O-antigen ligase family protein [Pseudomonas segetis]|uniref:O-antigen ligase n=1 Tax=Pseudomonas segetis TaxID=298908 RepID=A0A239D2L1_9PSED|nr:O-antigen ligase family protein [Pseudomonas segetis]SNS26382.1 O-antigen ligase [Pseudomonas segetis]
MDFNRLEFQKVSALVVVFFAFSFFSISCVLIFISELKWHDQQRVAQLILLFFALIGFVFSGAQRFSHQFFFIFVFIFICGLFSCADSEYVIWSLKEWACYGGLVILALYVSELPLRTHVVFPGMIVFVLVLLSFQFLVAYISAYLSGIYMLESNVLIGGFSNPRFYGQFQVIALPIATCALRWLWSRDNKVGAVFLFGVLSVQWVVAYCLAGRGVLVGLMVANIALLIVAVKFWRIVALQAAVAGVGLGLYLVFFFLIPSWFDIDVNLRDGLRTSLSGREVIWGIAWELFIANPVLGVGPMNFSAVLNPIAAHPHQFILQLLAEWGGGVAVAVLLLMIYAARAGWRFIRSGLATDFDAVLAISLVSAVVLAQVDGVFVMPYTETWLAIIAGLATARWTQNASFGYSATRYKLMGVRLLSILFLVVIGYTLMIDVPDLQNKQQAYLDSHFAGYMPRFWILGQIPWE